jgi:hypothetical protein
VTSTPSASTPPRRVVPEEHERRARPTCRSQPDDDAVAGVGRNGTDR